MTKEAPDHHDADLVLRAYELRREPVMRESRNLINGKFWPRNYEEFIAITKPDHDMNAAFRQTSSYWEMVYSFARHGVVNPDFFIESNGEGLFLFAKILPFLERFRKEGSPTAFQNAEWIATQCESGKKRFSMVKHRVEQMMNTK